MGPWTALSERIAAALEGAVHKPNILAGPHAQVTPDTILLRPDSPWVSRGQDGKPVRFGAGLGQLQRYVAVCAVRATDPPAAQEALYTYAQAVLSAASDEAWDWLDVGGIVLDETTDTPLLTVTVRLTYSGGAA